MPDSRSDWFISRVSEQVSSCKDKTLLFFRGFAWPQVRMLLGHPQALLRDPSYAEAEGLCVPALCACCDELVAAAKAAVECRLGIYEELLAMRDRLDELKDIRILVVENEL